MCERCAPSKMPRAVIVQLSNGTELTYPNYGEGEAIIVSRVASSFRTSGRKVIETHHGKKVRGLHFSPPRHSILGEQW
jgi:hypothetical protein